MSDGDYESQGRKRMFSEEGGSGEPRQKRRYGDGTSHEYEVRFLIQSQEAGTLIGRGGDNIKRLRQDFNAGIQLSDNRGSERIVTLSGTSDVIRDIMIDMLRSFDEKRNSRSGGRDSRENSAELRMIVHQSQAGCVIGRGGLKLKEIRTDYSVDVKVYAQCCPMSTDRIVRVSGPADNVVRCLISIVEMLRTWPPKGVYTPYDPVNSDPYAINDYGGFADEGRGGATGGGSSGGGGGGASRFSGGDRYSDRDRRGGDAYYGDRDHDRMPMPGPGMNAGAFGYPVGAMQRGMGGGPPLGSITTQQVSIPADLAGVIIGKSGSKIKQIRVDSGAEVELSDGTGGSSDRIITITGSLQQIQTAQYMLQMAVKQHLEREGR